MDGQTYLPLKSVVEIKQSIKDFAQSGLAGEERKARKESIVKDIQAFEMKAAQDPSFGTYFDIQELRSLIGWIQRLA